MVDVTWPDDLAPYRCGFNLQPHVGGTESPVTRTRKVYGLSAPRWLTGLTIRGGYWGRPSEVAGWGPRIEALIDAMEGGLNRVALWDFRRPRPRQTQYGLGLGLTNVGATAGATSMEVAGFVPHSIAFSIGDYVGGDGRAHRVSSPSIANGSGVATVVFVPPLSADVSSGSVAVVKKVSSWFRLASDASSDIETEVGQITEYRLEFVEDLLWLA